MWIYTIDLLENTGSYIQHPKTDDLFIVWSIGLVDPIARKKINTPIECPWLPSNPDMLQ